MKTFTTLELESNYFRATRMAEYLDGNRGTFNKRSSDLDVAVIFDQKNVAEGSFSAFLKRAEAVNQKAISLLCAVLLTAGFKNCVCHVLKLLLTRRTGQGIKHVFYKRASEISQFYEK